MMTYIVEDAIGNLVYMLIYYPLRLASKQKCNAFCTSYKEAYMYVWQFLNSFFVGFTFNCEMFLLINMIEKYNQSRWNRYLKRQLKQITNDAL